MNKFEQVSSDHLQISLAGQSPGLMPGGHPSSPFPGGVGGVSRSDFATSFASGNEIRSQMGGRCFVANGGAHVKSA